MEKPNLERIALLLAPDWDLKSMAILPTLEKHWSDIESGLLPYGNNTALIPLLEKYGLENHLADFHFIAFMFLKWMNVLWSLDQLKERNVDHTLNLLEALSTFLNNETGLWLNLTHGSKTKCKIHDPQLLNVVFISLIEYFKDHDIDMLSGSPFPEDVVDWKEYINERLKREKSISSKPGARDKNKRFHRMILFLWKYLQTYTELKGRREDVKDDRFIDYPFSRPQGNFINDYLKLLNIYTGRDAENIRSIFKKCLKEKKLVNA